MVRTVSHMRAHMAMNQSKDGIFFIHAMFHFAAIHLIIFAEIKLITTRIEIPRNEMLGMRDTGKQNCWQVI
jgi:hypothetical protein